MRTTRILLALAAFVLSLQWSKPAFADVTITGTVGEVGAVSTRMGQQGCGNPAASIVRFKLTDVNQTATCADQTNNMSGATTKYAYFIITANCAVTDGAAREWYAALLYSKKGAPITCTMTSGTDCHITSCTLP